MENRSAVCDGADDGQDANDLHQAAGVMAVRKNNGGAQQIEIDGHAVYRVMGGARDITSRQEYAQSAG